MESKKELILTGDRPTGKLHIGHFVGALQQRVKYQELYQQFVLVADLQAMTDNFEASKLVRESIVEITLDNLAVGVDPQKTTFCVQSLMPELTELTFYFLNLVTHSRLKRNPTVKSEIAQKGYEESVPMGFFCYPVSQAADIAAFKATLVPVGDDQLPMIEQTVEIVRSFNRIYGNVLVEPRAQLSNCGRLCGLDGNSKMGKSLNNCIYLADSEATIKKKVNSAFTDPQHLRVEDPGHLEGNVVFHYLDAFDPDSEGLADLKARYIKGGVADGHVKQRLLGVLCEIINPIRERREQLAKDRGAIITMLKEHTDRARQVVASTLDEVRSAMLLDQFY